MIVKKNYLKDAKTLFTDTNINITTDGRKHLGAVAGSDTYKVQYIEDLVDDCNTQLKLLSTTAETQSQAAYLAFVSGFRSRLNYFMRTIPKISHHLVSLEQTLRNRFIPAITGGHICSVTERKLLSLPTRFGGLTIPIFYEKAEAKNNNSRKLTAQLALMIQNQIKQYAVEKTQIKITKQVIKKEKKDRCHTSLDQLRNNLSEKFKRLLDVSIEKGVSNWLTVLPISDFGFELSKQHFCDAIRLRYVWSIAKFLTTCPGGSRFSIQHCISCKKGLSCLIRHNDLRDLTATMLSEVCKAIETEPKLTPFTGEELDSRTINTRLDIRARGVWKRGQQPFLDLKVFDTDAYRYLNSNERTRKEHTMREFCKLNMVHLHHWFF